MLDHLTKFYLVEWEQSYICQFQDLPIESPHIHFQALFASPWEGMVATKATLETTR